MVGDWIAIKFRPLTPPSTTKLSVASINRPGGTGRIINMHYADQDRLHHSPVVIALDVKYTISSGQDLHLDPELVQPHIELTTRGRRRAPAEAPVPLVAIQNCLAPNSSHRLNKNSKKISKSRMHVTLKKRGVSKSKISLPRKIDIPVRIRNSLAALKAVKSPKCTTKKVVIESGIPFEIVFNTNASNTPNSGC